MATRRPSLFRFGRLILRRQITVEGAAHLPSNGPFIVAANHEGFLDAPVVSVSIFERTGATPVFPTTPWIWRRLSRLLGPDRAQALGILPIDEDHPGDVLAAARSHLEQGGIIGIFPEGRRNHDPNLRRGKTGTVRLALATGAPIIPAGVVAGRGAWGDLLLALLFRRRLRVSFGPAIDLSAWKNVPITKPLLNELTARIMVAIGQLRGKSPSPQ